MPTLDEVRQLNYAHHVKMTNDAAASSAEETAKIIRLDDESYRSLLSIIPKGDSLLEIGASYGRQWNVLGEWGTELSGIDLYEPEVEVARREGKNIVVAYAEELPFPDESISAIVSRHVMEHVADIPKVLSEIKRVLKHGGYVAAITPHYFPDPEPSHVNQLRIEQWKAAYEKAGFTVISSELRTFNCVEAQIVARKGLPLNIDRALNTAGWMIPEELTYLAHAASKSVVIAEIGSYSGRSTLALAVNAPPGAIVYACDHWQGSVDQQEALKMMPSGWLFDDFTYNLRGITNVWPLAVNSLQAARWMATQGKTFDLIFIDASHDFESVKADIMAWKPLLKDGGILAGHNYGDPPNPGVKQAVDLLIPKFQVIGTIWTTEE